MKGPPLYSGSECRTRILLPTTTVLAIWVVGQNPGGTPGNDWVPAGSLPLCLPQGHTPQKAAFESFFLADDCWPNPAAQRNLLTQKGGFKTIKLSHRFLGPAIGTRITASQAAVVSMTEAGAFRSEAAGHSAI